MVNGYRFRTKERALRRKTQNSGVLVKGDISDTEKEYYGVLEDVYELNYVENQKEMTGLRRGRGGRGGKVTMRSTSRGRHDNQEVSSTPHSIPLQEVPRVEDQHQICPVAQWGFQIFPDIIEEEIEESQIGEESINPSAGSCTSKAVRGKYKSLSLDMKTRNGKKVKINIPEGLQRAVGVDARDIASYCGFVLRQTEKFEILDDRRALAMDTFIIDTLQRLFRAWKNRLHTQYKKFPIDQERFDNWPIDVTLEDWNWLLVKEIRGIEQIKL
ncbi:uncharacterized protein G2W53_044545 [Senna tora]|uniref:Uncharacterized protein n=1 Tax=Senna tora TaxID=362788 RepID=A0A834SCR8_9FABA|nr:uncharacterized protein G2W53_044545 [Senna tora]